MAQSDPELIDYWRAALGSSKAGLAISTNDRKLLQQQLYRARAQAGEPELDALIISIPDIDGELWIVKKDCLDAPNGN